MEPAGEPGGEPVDVHHVSWFSLQPCGHHARTGERSVPRPDLCSVGVPTRAQTPTHRPIMKLPLLCQAWIELEG